MLDPEGPSAISPEEAKRAYADALKKVGGAEHLASFASRMQELQQRVAKRHSDGLQHCGFSVCDLRCFLQLVSSDKMRAFGIEQLEKLRPAGCIKDLKIADPKGFVRAEVKVVIKYGGSFLLLVDVNRATVVCATSDDLYKAVELAVETWNSSTSYIVEFEDHFFSGDMGNGYRHVQLVVSFCGVLFEVQFNVEPFLDAKKRVGHSSYKTERYVQETILYCAIKKDHDQLKWLTQHPGVLDIANATMIKDQEGRTSLHHAAFHGSDLLLGCLFGLQHGVNNFITDNNDQLPLQYAAIFLNWELAEAIVQHMITHKDQLVLRLCSPCLAYCLCLPSKCGNTSLFGTGKWVFARKEIFRISDSVPNRGPGATQHRPHVSARTAPRAPSLGVAWPSATPKGPRRSQLRM